MKIVVLAGGTSTEREISIVTGTQVCKALREKGHESILVDIYSGDARIDLENAFPETYDADAAAEYIHSFDEEIQNRFDPDRPFFGPNVLELCKAADVVFMGLHGFNGEDGKVQAVFDLMKIPYTGSGHLSSAMAMDKGISKQMFWQNQVPTPKGVILTKGEEMKPLEAYGLALPVVVKPCCGGSSVGVAIPKTEEEYQEALKVAFSYEDVLVVEEYIKGREFSIGVVEGKAYPIIELAPIQGFYDYHNKYAAGSTVETCPAALSEELTKKMQSYAEQAYRALRLEKYARIDFMMDEQNQICLLYTSPSPRD